MNCAKNQYLYFAPEDVQNWVKRNFVREYTPISSLAHGNPIEFNIPGSELMHLELGTSYLYIRGKITLPNDANLPANADVAPVNLTLHSLFNNIDVELCGKTISDPNGMYMYRAYIESLLTFSKDYQETQLHSAVWHKDTPGQMEDWRRGHQGSMKVSKSVWQCLASPKMLK